MSKLKKKSGYDVLSKISGLSESVIKDIAKNVIENNKKLNSCSFHIFEQMDDPAMSRIYVCKNCKGTVRLNQKKWYEKGIEHCQKREEV